MSKRASPPLLPGSRRLGVPASLCLATILWLCGCATTATETSRAEPQGEVAARADRYELLREAADHEALFTLAGGLKPMSTGIWHGSFAVDAPDLTELRAVRAALDPLRNETWYADVQVFADVHEGERSAHAFVVHRRALSRMIERFASFWSPWGITPCTHPSEVVAVVDRMPRADRWRGYGYLFGFPADAVDFFVETGMADEDPSEIGPGKDRQFVQIPTFAADSGRFTYAAPLASERTAADDALARTAKEILEAYAERRGRMRDVDTLLHELRRLDRRFEHAAILAARERDRGATAPDPVDPAPVQR